MSQINRSVEELAQLPVRTYRKQQTDPSTVAEYAGLMERGVTFPPLTIAVVGKKKTEVLVGGAHRLAAATKAKIKDLAVNLVTCKTTLDAEVLAFTDNVNHGLNLTAEEKRQAILEILQTPAMKKVSNAAAAKRLGVSDMSIKRYRDALGTKSPKAKMSGHKGKAKTKAKDTITVDKGGKVEPKPTQSDPIGWNISGAQLGGGAERVANVIAAKVMEGLGKGSAVSYNKNLEFLREVASTLAAYADANKI